MRCASLFCVATTRGACGPPRGGMKVSPPPPTRKRWRWLPSPPLPRRPPCRGRLHCGATTRPPPPRLLPAASYARWLPPRRACRPWSPRLRPTQPEGRGTNTTLARDASCVGRWSRGGAVRGGLGGARGVGWDAESGLAGEGGGRWGSGGRGPPAATPRRSLAGALQRLERQWATNSSARRFCTWPRLGGGRHRLAKAGVWAWCLLPRVMPVLVRERGGGGGVATAGRSPTYHSCCAAG